jgi:hypothetical protein
MTKNATAKKLNLLILPAFSKIKLVYNMLNKQYMKKLNCWEFKKCGKGLGGENAFQEVCPAATNVLLDGIHEGTNAGRACWTVSGTMCDGEVQGTFAQKLKNCGSCKFYATVKTEEGENLQVTLSLLKLAE